MNEKTRRKRTNNDREPALTFWGAASSVSGSMHMLEAHGQQILLDCGLHQGRREEAYQRNRHFPFHPEHVDVCIVSHAHIDHCGNLPTLLRQGFRGPVYVTPPTHDLIRVMLRDSAKIQEEDAAHLNIARNYAEPWVQPLYTQADVQLVFDNLVSVPYGDEVELDGGIRFRFLEAGHILGSAMVHVSIDHGTEERSLVFTGDLGRRGLPFLRPTAAIPPCDMLVCESTYGNRVHTSLAHSVAKMEETITQTVERGGRVLIPAFSLGRTQLIVHLLQKALLHGRIPRVPIYVDSPLAAEVAEVYRHHAVEFVPEVGDRIEQGLGVLGGDGVQYIRTYQQSSDLTTRPGPHVIISASGMCDAGRVVSHLRQIVDDPRCTVILVSYQAPGTTGRRLSEAKPTVWLQGKECNKWVDVVHLDGFSGHADRDDFVAYLQPMVDQIGKIRLIHAEAEQAEALTELLGTLGYHDVQVPKPADRDTLR